MGAAVHSPNMQRRRWDCSCNPHLQTAAPARKIRHPLIPAANFLLKNLALFHISDQQSLSDCKLPGARNILIEGPVEGRFGAFFFPLVNTVEIQGLFHFKCMCNSPGRSTRPEQEWAFICKLLVLATLQNVFPRMYFTLIITAWWVYIKSL